MSYTEKPAQYVAVQLGSGDGAQDEFLTAIGFTLGDGGWAQSSLTQAVENADGTVSIAGAYPAFVVAVGDWMVSYQYWGTFPGWGSAAPNSHFTNEQFADRFTSS